MTNLDPRLSAIAEAVRHNSWLFDIGSDHAYLPIALAKAGRIAGAVATDLREGPLQSANAHIADAGVGALVSTRLLDGLAGLREETAAILATGRVVDIVIAGMGGELIASILEKAPFVRDPAVRLLLQPMTKAEVLRQYLASVGFTIEDERLARDEGRISRRIYQIIVAGYAEGAQNAPLSPLEALAGRQNLSRRDDPLCHALLEGIRKKTLTALHGKESAGHPHSEESALLHELDSYLP